MEENVTLQETEDEKVENEFDAEDAQKSKKKKIISIGIALAVVVIAAIVLISIINSNSAEGVAKTYINAFLKPDFKKLNSIVLVPLDTQLEKYAKKEGKTVDEFISDTTHENCSSLSEVYKYADEYFLDGFEDDYGEYDYEIRSVKVDEMKSKELKAYKDSWTENEYEREFDILAEKINAVAEVTVKVRINGEDESKTKSFNFTLVKYNGRWCSTYDMLDFVDHKLD